MRKPISRIISVLLALVLISGMVPAMPGPVQAATTDQLNMAARADYMYDSTWVCQQTTTCCAYGTYYTFYVGTTYRIPYGQNTSTGAYIGYGVSMDTFLSAAANASSVFYSTRGTNGYNGYYSFYYATDCSGFVSYCWDLTYKQSTRSIASVSTYIGAVTTNNCTYSLQLGDAINSYDNHVVMVSGLTYDSSGAITQIEITESTIPTLKRTYYTPAQLASKYGSYDGIYRYYGTVDAPPNKDHWISDSTGMRYQYADGTYATGWTDIDGNWYYFSSSTYMFAGWLYDEGYQGWYFFDTSTGIMKTGFHLIEGYYYYFDSSGRMLTGWQKIDGYWYYLNTTDYWPLGAMFTGWHEIDGEHYFFSETSGTIGQMQTGWVQVGSDWFYCNANGIRQYGWQEIDGALYYLDETSGIMAKKTWLVKDGTYIYMNASGAHTEGAEWTLGDTYKGALDIGTDFYATIDIPATGTRAGVDSDTTSATYKNLEVQAVRKISAEDFDEQQWYFQRRDDGSYRITNVATGMCLDVAGGYVDKGTNVRVWTGNDAIAQRWFIFENGDGYGLVAACNAWDKTVLDVADGLADEGTNIRVWAYNGSSAQRFTIDPVVCQHAWSYGVCGECGETCGHSFSEGVCTVCGLTCEHKFSNGACTRCGMADPDYTPAITVPTLTLSYPTLSFEDQIQYNVYFTVSDLTDVAEMGLISFDSKLTDGTIADAVDVISGYTGSDGTYVAHTAGIPAKNLGDALYFKVYAKLTDGSYIYTDVAGYNAVAYAKTILSSSSASMDAKRLMVAMLNYGAEAQVNFGYDTDNLMNSFLTDTGRALVNDYDESMVDDVVAADSARAGHFVMESGTFTSIYPTVSFEGAFSVNYYFKTGLTPDNGLTFAYWDADTYESVDKLTTANVTGMMKMTQDGDLWTAAVEGIAAKDMDKTIYVVGIYKSGGTAYTSKVIPYSIGKYCETIAAQGNEFGAATAVYGYYAKTYFANL